MKAQSTKVYEMQQKQFQQWEFIALFFFTVKQKKDAKSIINLPLQNLENEKAKATQNK